MLQYLHLHLGVGGTLLVLMLAAASILAWMLALAGLTVSEMHWAKKLGLQALLTIFPPLSLVVLGTYAVRGDREGRRA